MDVRSACRVLSRGNGFNLGTAPALTHAMRSLAVSFVFFFSLSAMASQELDTRCDPASGIVAPIDIAALIVAQIDPTMRESAWSQTPSMAFEMFFRMTDSGMQRTARNAIQRTIIDAANCACAEYETLLQSIAARGHRLRDLFMGIELDAGSIIAPDPKVEQEEEDAHAAMLNDIEFGVAMVVAASIDRRRNQLIREYRANQQVPVEEYSLGAAVADAIDYHGSCSASVALDPSEKMAALHQEITISALVASIEQLVTDRANPGSIPRDQLFKASGIVQAALRQSSADSVMGQFLSHVSKVLQ